MPLALLALAVAGFAVGTSEFAVMGLLPQVAEGGGVSIPAAGALISGYAVGVIVGAPLLTAVSARLPRRTTLLIVAALLTTGSVLSAVASGYGLMMAARVVAGVPQGALFGVGSVVAAELVPPERRGRAISIMFGGFTLANVAGVPLVTWLGQAAGRRATFWAAAGLVLAVRSGTIDARAEKAVLR
ncbi:MFS transporter [Nonomuraea sp. NPDC005692]|uniref:MFS transporter n=1 Tax=Nonomuraea sp. NPDC005692 TaxID=3157168 RepID=UPI0033EEC629